MKTNFSRFAVAALLLFSLGAEAQPPEARKVAPEPPMAPLPEQIVAGFVDAVSAHLNLDEAALLVEGGQTGDALKPVAAELQKGHDDWTMNVLGIDVQVKDDTASVKLMLRLEHRLLGRTTHQESLTMHKIQNEWKIVPLSPAEFQHSYSINNDFDSDIIATISTYLARPQEVHRASAFACLNNLKQIALYAFQFLNDFDERFAFKADAFLKAFKPYMRDEKESHCPDDKSGALSYSFNANLENVEQPKITQREKTVMLYEGKNGQLEFRHDNRAAVAFVDGHVELITPERAKTLKWKP